MSDKNKSWWNKLLGLKPICKLRYFCLLLLTLFSIFLFNNYEKIQQNLFIKDISNNELSYNGKLNYYRLEYSIASLNNDKIFITGQGKFSDITKTAEIYNVKKKKTEKEIKLINEHPNDFLLKLPNNNILIIGENIEIVNTKTSDVKEIFLPIRNYNPTNGVAVQLNDNEIFIITCKFFDLSEKEADIKSFILNIKTLEITETKNIDNIESIFLSFKKLRNPFIKFNNEIYLAGCGYSVEESNTNIKHSFKFIPQNCNIKKYNSKLNKFETIKFIENNFPYALLKKDNEEILIFNDNGILIYNIITNEVKRINIQNKNNLNFRYVFKISDNKIILMGNNKYLKQNRYPQYIVDMNKDTSDEYVFIDFKDAFAYFFGKGDIATVNNKIFFIGLFGERNVYSMMNRNR